MSNEQIEALKRLLECYETNWTSVQTDSDVAILDISLVNLLIADVKVKS